MKNLVHKVELAGLLLRIYRFQSSWYSSLSIPSFPLPLSIPVLIFSAVKKRMKQKICT